MKVQLTATDLQDLYNQIIELSDEDYQYLDWAGLPVFGGEEPESTEGIWSWDEAHILTGTCRDDLVIEER